MDNDKKEEAAVEAKVIEPQIEVDPLAEKDAEIAKLREERDNYKTVALARKGKLPEDSDLLGEDFDALVKAKVQETLADTEIARKEQEKQTEHQKLLRENTELRLALKNRPQTGLGSDSGTAAEVKDNVFSAAQLDSLKQKALRLKADPEKFIARAKDNFLKNNK